MNPQLDSCGDFYSANHVVSSEFTSVWRDFVKWPELRLDRKLVFFVLKFDILFKEEIIFSS